MKNYLKFNLISSKPYGLLLIAVILVFNNCKQENKTNADLIIKEELAEKEENENEVSDSTLISIHFKEKELVVLNLIDENFKSFPIDFFNKTSDDTIITRKISKVHDAQILYYGYRSFSKKGGVQQYFLIDSNTSTFKFELNKKKFLNLNDDKSRIIDKGIFKDYLSLWLKITKNKRLSKNTLIKELDTLYEFYGNKYSKDKTPLISQINDLQYMSHLEYVDQKNDKVHTYAKSINFSVVGGPLFGLMKNYVEHRIKDFDFDQLNLKNHSPDYIKFLAVGIFRFLRIQKNKGDAQYLSAANWLKTTDYYRTHKVIVDKEISNIDNKKFKELLNKVRLSDTSFNNAPFSSAINYKTSKYYLLDFWATWCAPCIVGIKKMDKMELPATITVISLSVDKIEDKEKWQIKTNDLGQKNSFWIDNSLQDNREFLKFIDLKLLPRYVLIDEKWNLIDYAFLNPNHPSFLKKLNQLK